MAVEKIINLKVNDDIKDTENNVVSLKRQLREAQQDVQTLADKFGATSTQAVEAAKKAAELKDRIGDAKNLTDAFNPDAKFKALSASIGGVASGFAAYQGALGLAGVESKKLQEQLLQVQSAMALAQGLQGLGEARDSFKQLGAVAKSVFAGIKNAIGATGIGLLVIALGAIYAYWDDIKEAVNGVSNEQKKLNVLAEKNVQTANENLKSAKSMDNTLKLQGKSEQQILDIKIKATQEAINANIKRVKGLELTNKLEAEAAQRNYERLKSFIDFVSIPQRILFETAATAINKIIDLANKIPGIEIKGKIDEKFASQATDFITKLAFDPEKTKAEGAANLKETQNAIRDLTNERDGYTNEKNKKDDKNNKDDQKSVADKRKEELEKINAASKEITEVLEDREKKKKEIIDKANAIIKQGELEKETPAQKLKREYEEELAVLTEAKKSTLQLTAEYNNKKFELENQSNQNLLQDVQYWAKQEQDVDLATKQAKRDALNTGLDILLQFAGKNKAVALSILAVQKGLAIADIIVNASKALAVGAANLATIPAVLPPGIPNPAFPLAVAATTKSAVLTKITAATSIASILAAGIGQAQSITGGGGGGSASGGGGGGSAAAPPSFNIVGQNSNNQLAQTIAGQQQQPVQAYVVSGNVSSAQSLDRNRIDTATFN
jgi:hypothetical protein